jgi:hypothetical protein
VPYLRRQHTMHLLISDCSCYCTIHLLIRVYSNGSAPIGTATSSCPVQLFPELLNGSVRRSPSSLVSDHSFRDLRDGTFRAAIVFPCAALCNHARCRADGESPGSRPFLVCCHVKGIETGAPPRARRQRRYRRRRTIVAKVVEEDAPGTRLLCYGAHIAVRTVGRHSNCRSCHPDQPGRLVFDLDLATDVAFDGVIAAPTEIGDFDVVLRSHHFLNCRCPHVIRTW